MIIMMIGLGPGDAATVAQAAIGPVVARFTGTGNGLSAI